MKKALNEQEGRKAANLSDEKLKDYLAAKIRSSARWPVISIRKSGNTVTVPDFQGQAVAAPAEKEQLTDEQLAKVAQAVYDDVLCSVDWNPTLEKAIGKVDDFSVDFVAAVIDEADGLGLLESSMEERLGRTIREAVVRACDKALLEQVIDRRAKK